MSDETKNDTDESTEKSGDAKDERVTDAETAFEEYTSDNKCPECGEPVIDVRANCPKCGYEYQDSDYGDSEAGSEFVAGSAVDDEGNEDPDDETGKGEDDDEADDDKSDDDEADDSASEDE